MKLSIIYVILPFITLFIVSRIKVKNINSEKLILFFFAVSYIFLCGLRDGGGADDLSYRAYYEKGYGGNITDVFWKRAPIQFVAYNLHYIRHELQGNVFGTCSYNCGISLCSSKQLSTKYR